MTGTIIQLDNGAGSGVIKTEDGLRAVFFASAVNGGLDALELGERVRFDYDRTWSEVEAVQALREPPRPTGGKPDLRYVGFDQEGNVRHFKFDSFVTGNESRQRFVVTVDMDLFRAHHISVQDGPELCLHKLMAELESSPDVNRHVMSDADLLSYEQTRRAVVARKLKQKRLSDGHRHRPVSPAPWGRPPGQQPG